MVFFLCAMIFIGIKTTDMRVEMMQKECTKKGGTLTHVSGATYVCKGDDLIIKMDRQKG